MKKTLPAFYLAGFLIFTCSSCGPSPSKDLIATDSLSIAVGRTLFQTNCSSCHNFRQDGIGPDLSGVTETDSVSWIRNFIRDPKSLAASGDAHTKKLMDRYHTLMPSFAVLTESQINQLLSFLKTQKAHPKRKEDPLAIKDPVPEKIAASNIVAGLSLFAQMPSTSSKEPLTRISKMDWVPAAKSYFVLDQRGIIYKLINGKPVVWLDISKWKPKFINEPGLATGFGCFVFHPDFARNGIFYTTHCESPRSKKADFPIPDSVKQTLQWVLCEWKLADSKSSVFSGTNRELMRIDMLSGIHGVQEIIFNPRSKPGDAEYGNLYIGVGDGGSVENGYAFLTHHPQKIWGTILRINPLGKNSANGQYGIPSSNPFVKIKDSNTVREIYADGFRNPNRITWTNQGLMLATNIGQANIEAIDIIQKGNHYGWPIREGSFAMHPDADINNLYALPSNDSLFHISYPVAVFDHDEGKAIEGGFEYTGKAIPEFKGKYVFGDIPSGRLFYVTLSDLKPGTLAPVKEWFVSLNGKRISLRSLCGEDRVDLRFARDEQGELYIFTKPDGKIYKLN
jgi:glucose/arabinose dehydrogenase/mono/diheme cytochrome c family protein